MKVSITFKDPDAVYEAIRDAAMQSLRETPGLSPDEIEELVESRHEKLAEKCGRWIKYGEYVTIEIDTDAGTVTVEDYSK